MTKADTTLLEEIDDLRKLSVAGLRARYLEVFGEETSSRNKDYLFKRIAYRLQERKYGGLTPRARAPSSSRRTRRSDGAWSPNASADT